MDLSWPEVTVADNHAEVLGTWLIVEQAIDVVKAAIGTRMEQEAGCTMLEHHALFRLATAPERRMSMLRLSEALATSPSGATRVVDRLVKRGWAVREQPAENRRQTFAVLTEEGYASLVHRTRPVYHQALAESFGSLLGSGDLADLQRIGRRILEGHDRFRSEWVDVSGFAS